MPIIRVEMFQGRSLEQKRALVKTLTEETATHQVGIFWVGTLPPPSIDWSSTTSQSPISGK